MNMSGCFKASDMRRQATSKYLGSISMPVNLRPSLTAATTVMPEPIKGSRIEDAGGGICWMRQHMTSSDFCVGCSFPSCIATVLETVMRRAAPANELHASSKSASENSDKPKTQLNH